MLVVEDALESYDGAIEFAILQNKMPSKAKGRSEYKNNFKWLESFRGKGFKPAPEQMAPPAGKSSVFSSVVVEPPLQHKKRLAGPPTSLSVNFEDKRYDAAHDFALLGQQDKFASNVRYGLRPAKPAKLEEKDSNNNNVVKDHPPPPKQMKLGGTQAHVRRKLDVSESKGKVVSSKENLSPTSPPPAPRKSKGKDMEQQEVKQGLRDKNLSDILPKAKPPKDDMNEFAQTDLDKGVALSGQEATADYSLKYKAGIAQPRLSRKASEYQKEFNWKKGMPASPLLSAEQIIYNSSAQITPLKQTAFQKKTEYQTQFKTFKIPEASKEPSVADSHRKSQARRSKSVGAARSPDRTVPAGSAPVTSSDDPRQLRQSHENIPAMKVPIPYGKLKRGVSEYRSNFKAPTIFSYEDGAWRKAYPPQLLNAQNGGQDEKKETHVEEVAPVQNWFAEVLELRRRADEYKRRAQGTHFSRQHLVQLLAQQASCWDIDSARISAASLDALALEPAKQAAPSVPVYKQEKVLETCSEVAVQGDSPKPTESNSLQSNKCRKKKGSGAKASKMAWQEESVPESIQEDARPQDLNTNQNAAVNTEPVEVVQETETEEVQGRLPTPVLRQQTTKAARHHLDRTTPSMGGLLISDPDQQLSYRSDETEETVSSSPSSMKDKFSAENQFTSPILGKATADTHALRNDDAQSDAVLETHFIPSPMTDVAHTLRKQKREQKKQNMKVPATIDERMGLTYNKDVGNFHVEDLPLCSHAKQEDDVLSLSARSIASSSSLASEVYERARRRRDEFWGKPSK